MGEDLKLLRMMPWKHKLIIMIVFLGGILVFLFPAYSRIYLWKYVMLLTLLLIASYFDYRYRIIPDWIHVLILFTGLIDFDITKSLLGVLISPLPFLISALIQKESIGGGDIKLIGTLGFSLGFVNALSIMIISLIFVILSSLRYCFRMDKSNYLKYPFAPYILIGFVFKFLLYN